MKRTVTCTALAGLVAGIVALSSWAQSPGRAAASTPSIEGTYKLVSRTLTDGTTKTAPDVVGLLTYTKSHRNFNVYWTGDDGKVFSYSVISTYRLTSTEYSETVELSVTNDQIGGKELTYDTSGASAAESVSMEGGALKFKMPFDPVTATFDSGTMKAVSSEFTDTWQRVD